MDPLHALRGFALGFAVAAPVGPIGILVIRRTLADGRRHGFVSGLGAATADAAYGVVAAFGITAITAPLTASSGYLQAIGGAFLAWIGIRTMRAKPASEPAKAADARNLGRAYLSTLALTVTNPATILSFAAAFAALGLASQSAGVADATLMVAGVFVGSAAWWLILSAGVGALRSRIGPRTLVAVNLVSGTVLLAFGIWALVHAVPRFC